MSFEYPTEISLTRQLEIAESGDSFLTFRNSSNVGTTAKRLEIPVKTRTLKSIVAGTDSLVSVTHVTVGKKKLPKWADPEPEDTEPVESEYGTPV